jgi:2-polyprenyl-3-methyl-5-hydroxy-6-metoxy-1,4-benzoquinol methylase
MEDADVETSSEAYARRFSGAVGAWFLEVQERSTLDLLRKNRRSAAPLRVVDVGGGHGQLAGPLADEGHEVTVVGSTDACRSRVQSLIDAGRIHFRTGDLLHLPFDARSFDVALAFRLLPHVQGWQELIAELCRVAAGAVIVDYPSRSSANAAAVSTFAAKKRIEGDTRPFAVFADAEVDGAFGRQGFMVLERRRQFLLPMALHRALGMAAVSRGIERGGRALGLTGRFGSPVIAQAMRVDA